MDAAPKVFAGYALERELGRGGTAVVYLARRGTEEAVALKVLTRHGRTDEMAKRFAREIEAMARLDHPRILRLVDHGAEGEDLWYAMEYSAKRSLQDVLEERHAGGGILEIPEVMRLARGLAESLAYIHEKKLVHRDLKPENILVDERLDPTLMDFGLAKDFERSEMTAEGMIMGTPRYMAPEQVRGAEALATADVYQVGLILYRALTGGLPLEDDNPFATAMRRMQEAIPPPSKDRPNVPPGVDRILLQCLRSNSDERYRDMGAFLEDLERLDPETGELLPGQAMPGTVAEVRGESTMVTSGAGFQAAAGEGTMMGLAAKPAAPRASGGGTATPTGGGGMLVPAVAFAGVLVLGAALIVRVTSGGAAPVAVEGLALDRGPESVQITFRTDRPVEAMLELDPPAEGPYPLGDGRSKTHVGEADGLDPDTGYRYRLQLVDEAGTRERTPWQQVPAPPASGAEGVARIRDLRVEPSDGGVDVQFFTDVPGEARLRWGEGEPDRVAEAALTGKTMHSFRLEGLSPGRVYRYSIEVALPGGQVTRTPPQELRF